MLGARSSTRWSALPTAALRLTLGLRGTSWKGDRGRGAGRRLGRTGRASRSVMRVARERRVSALEALLRDAAVTERRRGDDCRRTSQGVRAFVGSFPGLPRSQERPRCSPGPLPSRVRRRPGLSVVVDLAATPDAPYYTGLTFSVDAAGVPGVLAAGGRYDALLARFGVPAPGARLLRRPRGARGRRVAAPASAGGPASAHRGREGTPPRQDARGASGRGSIVRGAGRPPPPRAVRGRRLRAPSPEGRRRPDVRRARRRRPRSRRERPRRGVGRGRLLAASSSRSGNAGFR